MSDFLDYPAKEDDYYISIRDRSRIKDIEPHKMYDVLILHPDGRIFGGTGLGYEVFQRHTIITHWREHRRDTNEKS